MNNACFNGTARLRQVIIIFLALICLMGNLNGVVNARSSIGEGTLIESETNQVPIANSMSVTTYLEEGVDITLTGSDPDGDPLTYSIKRQPQHGELEGNAPNLVYYPYCDFVGTDSFTFTANDGVAESVEATVTITVITFVNYPPVANSQSVTTLVGEAVQITLTGYDPNGDNLRYWIIGAPQHGVLRGTAPNLTYVPNTGFAGEDSFTFVVNDWSTDSRLAKVSITVSQQVNHQPIADNQYLSTYEENDISVILTADDEDDDPLAFYIKQNPLHGELTGSGSSFVYQPGPNFYGEDRFSFMANDGTSNSAEAFVFITVIPVNDRPTAQNSFVSTNENVPVNLTLLASDIDGDQVNYSIVNYPVHGTLRGVAPNLTYTPDVGYFGTDSFQFDVNDGSRDSGIATVSITIKQVYNPPSASNNPVIAIEGWELFPVLPTIPRQIYFDAFKPGLGMIRIPL